MFFHQVKANDDTVVINVATDVEFENAIAPIHESTNGKFIISLISDITITEDTVYTYSFQKKNDTIVATEEPVDSEGTIDSETPTDKNEPKEEDSNKDGASNEEKTEQKGIFTNPKTGDNIVRYATTFIVAMLTFAILKKKIKEKNKRKNK